MNLSSCDIGNPAYTKTSHSVEEISGSFMAEIIASDLEGSEVTIYRKVYFSYRESCDSMINVSASLNESFFNGRYLEPENLDEQLREVIQNHLGRTIDELTKLK